jgi:hypothetical protein
MLLVCVVSQVCCHCIIAGCCHFIETPVRRCTGRTTCDVNVAGCTAGRGSMLLRAVIAMWYEWRQFRGFVVQCCEEMCQEKYVIMGGKEQPNMDKIYVQKTLGNRSGCKVRRRLSEY